MKRFSRIGAIIASFILIFTSFVLIISANEAESIAVDESYTDYTPKEAIAEGYFLYYSAEDGKAYKYLNSTFASKLINYKDGDVVTLLSDLSTTTKIELTKSALSDGSAQTLFINLNGYSLARTHTNSGQSFLQCNKNSTVIIYSSDDAHTARIFTSATLNSSLVYHTTFAIRGSNCNIRIGDATEAPVISTAEAAKSDITQYTPTISARNCKGENIESYGSALFTSYIASERNTVNSEFYVSGITHYQMYAGRSTIAIYSAADVTLDRVSFISNTADSHFLFSHNAKSDAAPVYTDGVLTTPGMQRAPADANVTVTNSTFYTKAYLVSGTMYESPEAIPEYEIKASEIVFENCNIYAEGIAKEIIGTPTFKNCRFGIISYFDGENEIVKCSDNLTIKSPATSFRVNESGQIDVEYSYDPKFVDLTLHFSYASASDDNIANITWISPSATVTERWIKSEGSIPTPLFASSSTEVYTYSYTPSPISTLESGDATYTLDSHINFTVKANLALYSDFVYNLYIPKSAADSSDFISARIDRYENDGTVTLGAKTPVKGGAVARIQVAPGYYEEYYVLQRSILATEGDMSFRLVITAKGAFGETITHQQNFSIIDYAERVIAGNYTDDAKAMVCSTITYIKTARNYLEDITGNPLPYPIAENEDISSVKGCAVSTPRGEIGDEAKKVIRGMTLSLEEKIKFRFYFTPGFDDTVTIIYPVNTKPTSVSINAEDCKPQTYENTELVYYDVTMRAIDLRSAIKIDLSSTEAEVDYTYRLANYVNYAKGTSECLDYLLDAMFAYSIATNQYLRNSTEEDDTPKVDISVNGNKITADSYVIVATEVEIEAAEALKTAIYAKTGELLQILSEKPDGMKAITIAVTEPTPAYDLEISVSGSDLSVRSSYKSFINAGVSSFIEKSIKPLSVDTDFKEGYSENYYTDKIYYSDFGAHGVDLEALNAADRDISKWYGETLERISGLLTNDFFNMKKAHDFANTTRRHTVCADEGATYYISLTIREGETVADFITVSTPVCWTGANIVIDDHDLAANNKNDLSSYNQAIKNIFEICSYYDTVVINSSTVLEKILKDGLNQNTTRIDLGLNYPAMIIPYNSGHKIYRRKGYSAWAGNAMHEVIVIDENGNVDPTTPVMFDYMNLDYIEVYRIDQNELTVEGGTVTTISSAVNILENNSGYIFRGINVQRSNTTVRNIEHKIIGEVGLNEQVSSDGTVIHVSAPYHGFFSASNTSYVTFEDCILQGRRAYTQPGTSGENGKTGGTGGTYDLAGTAVNELVFRNCVQSNFWVTVDKSNTVTAATEGASGARLSMENQTVNGSSLRLHWGIGGTNYCKNMRYIDSTLSRFDAHAGLYNGEISNCTMNYMALTGSGEMLIENVTWYASANSASGNSIVYLRNDYGSTWDGTITLRNVKAYHYATPGESYTKNSGYVLYHAYANWYFGYECAFPNVLIDNLTFYDIGTGKLLNANERGTVQFVYSSGSFMSEPNIHLSTTVKTSPYFEDRDEDNDGFVDGTNIAYDGTVSTSGVQDKSQNANLNPIKPPEFIRILNNTQNYDYRTKLISYMTGTSFFNGTEIFIGTTDSSGRVTVTDMINKGKNGEGDSPTVDFD